MIGICHRPGSYSEKWIEYCIKNNVEFKIVNCYDSDIIRQLKECNGLMWHWSHLDYKANLIAKQIIFALEQSGKKVFPNSWTCWHYDDKIGQKYLLESINAPLIPTYVFYNKLEALKWINQINFPKVFKTRNGAGSSNVKLVKTKKEAERLINKCFGKGIPSYDKFGVIKEKVWELKRDKNWKYFFRIGKYLLKATLPMIFQPHHTIEKGYIYFQDFIPNNNSDTRIYIIGKKSFGLIRYNRKNDFRASGSGLKNTNPELINEKLVKIAYDVASKLSLQMCAIDFVMFNSEPMIVEISYAFGRRGKIYSYWDENFKRHDGEFCFENFMMEHFLDEIDNKRLHKNNLSGV